MKVKERVERLAFRTVLSVNRLIHEEKAENFVDTAIKILMVPFCWQGCISYSRIRYSQP